LGDYTAKAVQDEMQGAEAFPRHYVLLLADGTKHKFSIIGEEE
jgi:hypothetical protein